MKYFKVECYGDTMYMEALSLEAAQRHFADMGFDEIPKHLLKWEEVDEIPDGEELL